MLIKDQLQSGNNPKQASSESNKGLFSGPYSKESVFRIALFHSVFWGRRGKQLRSPRQMQRCPSNVWKCKACYRKRTFISGPDGREPEYVGMACWDCSWKETVCKPAIILLLLVHLLRSAWSCNSCPGDSPGLITERSHQNRIIHLLFHCLHCLPKPHVLFLHCLGLSSFTP